MENDQWDQEIKDEESREGGQLWRLVEDILDYILDFWW